MTTPPESIASLYERVAKKVPEMMNCGLKPAFRSDRPWYHEVIGYISVDHIDVAHLLIEAACVRLLPGYAWDTPTPGRCLIYEDSEGGLYPIGIEAPTLAEALLLAVEKQAENKP